MILLDTKSSRSLPMRMIVWHSNGSIMEVMMPSFMLCRIKFPPHRKDAEKTALQCAGIPAFARAFGAPPDAAHLRWRGRGATFRPLRAPRLKAPLRGGHRRLMNKLPIVLQCAGFRPPTETRLWHTPSPRHRRGACSVRPNFTAPSVPPPSVAAAPSARVVVGVGITTKNGDHDELP